MTTSVSIRRFPGLGDDILKKNLRDRFSSPHPKQQQLMAESSARNDVRSRDFVLSRPFFHNFVVIFGDFSSNYTLIVVYDCIRTKN